MSKLKQKLLSETAKIRWQELQRFFAQGKVVFVASSEDLVEVAAGFATDDAERITGLLELGSAGMVSDVQAKGWVEQDAELWSVVVAPFVLVQELKKEIEEGSV